MTDDQNFATPDTSRLLMSDALKDLLPTDLVDAATVSDIAQGFVVVILGTCFEGNESPMTGVLNSFMFAGDELEVEANVQLEDGMKALRSAPDVVDGLDLVINFVELHLADEITRFEAGYAVAGARLCAIDAQRRMCTLLLNLQPLKAKLRA